MKEVYLEKLIISMALGSDKDRIVEVKKHFSKFNPTLDLENIYAKMSVHDWGVRKNQVIGLKTVLRKDVAMDFLKIVKNSDLITNKVKINNGRFIIGIPESFSLSNIEYSPIAPKYGLQVHIIFAYVGSVVKKKMRNKTKNQKILKEETIKKIIEEL